MLFLLSRLFLGRRTPLGELATFGAPKTPEFENSFQAGRKGKGKGRGGMGEKEGKTCGYR